MTESNGAPVKEQVAFWRGEFGDAYVDRNAAAENEVKSFTQLWARLLHTMQGDPPASILEVGSNVGINLRALSRLTDAALHAVEPNAKAREVLARDEVLPAERILDGTASAIPLGDASIDLAFTSGVLIHVHSDDLLASCTEIHRVTRRYIACIEYFADRPEEKLYRGHSEKLFKRDFGSFWLDNFPDLRLLDYGFAWKRTTALDNATWWTFEKT
jgi:pseudaminic acid biosynthesis-associated methylase